MNSTPPPGPHRFRKASASRPLVCDLTCSDAELYDLLYHYRRIHTLLLRYRAGGEAAQAAIERVLATVEDEARRRGIPLHRLPD